MSKVRNEITRESKGEDALGGFRELSIAELFNRGQEGEGVKISDCLALWEASRSGAPTTAGLLACGRKETLAFRHGIIFCECCHMKGWLKS